MAKKIALRIDDVGASSKEFEVYSRIPGGNFLFLKYLPFLKAWGPYDELSVGQWGRIFDVLRDCGAKLTVAITAAWVEKNGRLTPFPQKFPKQAAALKTALNQEIIEIANHGLTHCVIGKHLPKLFGSNRQYHREFWDWLDEEIHYEHLEKSQKILRDYFQTAVTTLVPPGNVFSAATVKAASRFGIKLINCHTETRTIDSVGILGEDNVLAFHDRELVLYGTDWLREQLGKKKDVEYCFVREL